MGLLNKVRGLVNSRESMAFLSTFNSRTGKQEICSMNSARMDRNGTISCAIVDAPKTFDNLKESKKGLMVVVGRSVGDGTLFGARLYLEMVADFSDGPEHIEMQKFVNKCFGVYTVSHRILFEVKKAEPSWEI